jgi:hypothetical protein
VPIHGKSTRVLVNGRDLSGILNVASSGISVDAADVTVFTSGAKEYQAGLVDGTMGLEGFVDLDPDVPAGVILSLQERLASWIGAKGNALVYPAGTDAVGSPGRACEFYETTLDQESPVDGVATLSVELQATDGIQVVRSLQPLVARTATGNGSNDDSAIAGGTALGGKAHLHVTAGSLAGTTLVVKVQGSADGSTGWADLVTFATVNGAATFVPASEAKSWAAGAAGSTPRYLRAAWTLAGTSPSFTFTVAAFRRLVTP